MSDCRESGVTIPSTAVIGTAWSLQTSARLASLDQLNATSWAGDLADEPAPHHEEHCLATVGGQYALRRIRCPSLHRDSGGARLPLGRCRRRREWQGRGRPRPAPPAPLGDIRCLAASKPRAN